MENFIQKMVLTIGVSTCSLFLGVITFVQEVNAAPPAEPFFTPSCTPSGSTWNVTLNWTQVTGAANYPVRLRNPNGVDTVVGNGGLGQPVDKSLSSYTFNVPTSGWYTAWMHAWNTDGWSTYTQKPVYCAPPAPPPPPPAEPFFTPSCTPSGSSWNVTLNWTQVSGADLYPVRLRNPSNVDTVVDGVSSSASSYTFSVPTAGTYTAWMHAFNYATGWSTYTQKAVTCSVAPLTAPTITNLFPYNNNVYFSWNPVPGAEYYAIRIDNRSNSWHFDTLTNPTASTNCSNDVTTDGSILSSPLTALGGQDWCGNISKNVPLEFYAPYIVSGSKNRIWIHARSADGTFGPMTLVEYDGSPQQPTGLSVSACDASGNATISWNSVATANHYALRVDDLTPSSLFDESSFPANNSACVFDTVDASTLLERTQAGYGTDYCGNMTNTSWTKTLIPGHTYKAWVHSKTDFAFGNLPYPEITFTCSAPSTQCSNGIDDADPEDTLVDMADPGCSSASDTDETNSALPPPPTQCSNGIDDADPEDTLVDMADPGCSSPSDNDETNALVAGIDLSAGSPTPDPSYLPLTAGTSIFRASITNIGTAVANGTSNSTLEVDLDNNGTYDVVGLTATPQITNQGTGAGNAVTVQASYNFTAGNHTVRFCADSTGAISESDEFNNCGAGVMFNFAAVNPFTLCRNTCDSGIVIGKSSIGLNNYPMNVGTTENIVACYNPTDNCSSSSGDVTTSISNWNEDLGSNVISLGSISGSKKPITAGSVGTENWLAQYLGLTVTVGTTVSGLANCSASTISNCILPAGINGNNVSGTCSVVGGSCNYTCVNGSWTTPSSNTCTAPTATPELKATPRLVSYGGSGTLIWDTNGTNEAGCSITGGSLGNSYASLPASGDPYEGSLPVSLIYGKTTYVLSCGTEFSTATFEVPSKGFET